MAALNPLPRWQRRGLYLSVTALLASGLAWLVLHYTIGAGTGELPHPAEPWLMKLHGAATMAGLFFFGTLVSGHVPRGWRMARQRRVGLALWTLLGLLVLSGYALYYFAPEAVRPGLGIAHAALGVALGVLLTWHRRGSRRSGALRHPHHLQHARRHHTEPARRHTGGETPAP